jgi:GxxExxY protein
MRVELLEAQRVQSIVAGFLAVYNYYGYGLSEAVYAGALEHELRSRGHEVAREIRVLVTYKGQPVTWQRLDMVVDQRIVVESKASEKLPPSARAQVITYLRATSFEVGLLLHFGPTPSFDRFVDSPKRARNRDAATEPPGRSSEVPKKDHVQGDTPPTL